MDNITKSQNTTNLMSALAEVQSAIVPVETDAENKHYKSKYATLTAVLDMLKPICEANGVHIYQLPFTEINADGIGVLETLIYYIPEKNENASTSEVSGHEWLSFKMAIPLPKNDPQGVGIALSYARRYALLSFFGIATEDTDGEYNRQPIKPAELNKLRNLVTDLAAEVYPDGYDQKQLAEWAGKAARQPGKASSFASLNKNALNILKVKLEDRKAELANE